LKLGIIASLVLLGCIGATADIGVRVGVVAFEDFDREYDKWETVLADFGRRSHPPLRFQLAAGTYGDLLDWMDRELVDVAILTSGVFATSQFSTESTPAYQHLATVGLPPAVSDWAGLDRRAAGDHFGYRSVCAVPADSPITSIEDLRHVAEQGRVQLVFVSPLSVSGRIAPTVAMREANITADVAIIYSQSHSEPVRLLTQPVNGLARVAFVWDDTVREGDELRAKRRRLPFPALDQLFLPHDSARLRRCVGRIRQTRCRAASAISGRNWANPFC